MSAPGQVARFFVISALGLCIDIGIAWLVHAWAGIALPLAALLGFFAAAVFNYVQHARWTFAGSRLSPEGFTVYLALLVVIAGIRFALVALLDGASILASYPLATLIVATAVTFFVNFSLSRKLVFRPVQDATMKRDGE